MLLPIIVNVMLVGLGLTVLVETTAMVPLMASLLVHARFEFGNAGRLTVLNAPLIGVLKRVNVSPAARAVEPRLFTVRVAPAFTTTLGAISLSLLGTAPRSIFMVTVPPIVVLPAVNVPIAAVNAPRAGMPGARFPPASTFTVPPSEPVPPSVPLELTVTGELPFAPLTSR